MIYGGTPERRDGGRERGERGDPRRPGGAQFARGRHDEQRPHRHRLRAHGHDRRIYRGVLRSDPGRRGLGLRALPVPAIDRQAVFESMLADCRRARSSPGERLAERGVTKVGHAHRRVRSASSRVGASSATVFVDASYDGDLMALGRRLLSRRAGGDWPSTARPSPASRPTSEVFTVPPASTPQFPSQLPAPSEPPTTASRSPTTGSVSRRAREPGPVHGARRLRPGDLRPPGQLHRVATGAGPRADPDVVPVAGRPAEQQVRRQQQRHGVDRGDGRELGLSGRHLRGAS